MVKKTLAVIGVILLCLVIAVGGYLGYLEFNYYRIDDSLELEVVNNQTAELKSDGEYSVMIYNIGFGAYDKDYSFFMDVGFMEDGTRVVGKHSRGSSKEQVLTNVNGMIDSAVAVDADFYMFQEVDIEATRSYKINQKDMITKAFPSYSNVFAENMHTPYLFYPFTEPHGKTTAGLLTLSKYDIDEAERRSYPVGTGFPERHTELDRAFTISRCPVDNGKELVLINSHMSAYDKGGVYREKQLELLNSVMLTEYNKGNYVIVGGDFNHTLFDSDKAFESKQLYPAWISILDENDIVDGVHLVRPTNYDTVATCRGADIPYEKGVTYRCIVDGFLVSENIDAEATNIDLEFLYSDHNPVQMTFRFK